MSEKIYLDFSYAAERAHYRHNHTAGFSFGTKVSGALTVHDLQIRLNERCGHRVVEHRKKER